MWSHLKHKDHIAWSSPQPHAVDDVALLAPVVETETREQFNVLKVTWLLSTVKSFYQGVNITLNIPQ